MTNDSPPPIVPSSFGRDFTEHETITLERLDAMSDEEILNQLFARANRRVSQLLSEGGSISGINEETLVSRDQRSA